MDTPLVTIVFPVYNVEPYLREALDGARNQTLENIQILCVNDGSTDGSPDVLEEYAAKDARVELLHQENRGGGSARNAAYPHIKGKYAFFADPDDRMQTDLCEKTFRSAEQAEADAVFINMRNMSNGRQFKFDHTLPLVRRTKREKKDLLHSFNSTCLKLWKTSFLVGDNVFFAEGRRPMNDMIQNWHGVTHADRIAILDEPLYCRRIRPGSYQQTKDASHLIVTDALREIRDMLLATGKYNVYRDDFISFKINVFNHVYRNIDAKHRKELYGKIQKAFTEEEIRECDCGLSRANRRFLNFVYGGMKGKIRYHFSEIMKWPERMIKNNMKFLSKSNSR